MAPSPERVIQCDPEKTLRVLFIGNSLTYVQNMPRQVEAIAASLSGPCIETEMIAVGGATLENHWRADSAARRIRSGNFTHVVMNDQSTFGEAWVIDGQTRVEGTAAELKEFGRRFIEVVRAANAKPFFLAHWSDKQAPPRDQQALDYAFATVAQANAADVIPAGTAVKALQASTPRATPYFEDGHHLSATGAYLEALVVYSMISGQSVAGATSRISGPAVEFNRGIVFRDSVVTLVDVPRELAKKLQDLATATVTNYRKTGHRVEAPEPLASSYPRVPSAGEPIDPVKLAGKWSGTSTVLSTPEGKPVAVTFIFHGTPGVPDSAKIQLIPDSMVLRPDAGRRTPPRSYAGVADIQVDGKNLTVRAPVGPQSAIVEFRMALKSGTLAGIAELHQQGRGGAAFHSIGRIEVRGLRRD